MPKAAQACVRLADPGLVHLGVAPARARPARRASPTSTMRPAVDDHDPVGPHGGREPVGDQDGGPALEQHVERRLDLRLGLRGRDWRWPRRAPGPGMGEEGAGRARSAGARPRRATGRARGRRCRGRRAVGRSRRRSPTRSTASRTSSSGASGRAKAMLSRMVPAKRNGSWGTTPSWLRSECEGHVAEVVAVDQHPAGGRVVEAGDQLGHASTCRPRSGPRRPRSRRARW